jgi:hypothetical protein
VRRYYASFTYQAQSWRKPRRVVAKVEWHPGELYPRVGFIVTNLARPAERVVAFYNQRGTAEQWIKEGKGAIKWTRLSSALAAHPEKSQRRPCNELGLSAQGLSAACPHFRAPGAPRPRWPHHSAALHREQRTRRHQESHTG